VKTNELHFFGGCRKAQKNAMSAQEFEKTGDSGQWLAAVKKKPPNPLCFS
jgi:hypothetical protein